MMNRRRFLALAAAVPLGGIALRAASSFDLQSASGEAGQAQVPMPFRMYVPGIARYGTPSGIGLSNGFAFQGGAVKATAFGGTSGQATIFGRDYPLAPAPDGTLSGYVPVDALDPAGMTDVAVMIAMADGTERVASMPLEIRETQWTVDHIVLPDPDPDAPPPDAEEEERVARETRRETDAVAAAYGGMTPRVWDDTWLVPVDGPVSGYFGEMRSYNGGPVGGHHGGTDFAVDFGTPIRATNHGTVVLADTFITHGNFVVIDHGSGIYSGYAHQPDLSVTAGQVVQQGDIVGYVGSTGLSTGPHLHWEMSVGGVLVDGLRWLDGTQGF